jgi:hypothetical protein
VLLLCTFHNKVEERNATFSEISVTLFSTNAQFRANPEHPCQLCGSPDNNWYDTHFAHGKFVVYHNHNSATSADDIARRTLQ